MAEVNNADVARKLGVSRASVCRFRNGSRLPRMETRKAIAAVINWPIEAQASAEADGVWAKTFDTLLQASAVPV